MIKQLTLFDEKNVNSELETYVEREGNTLLIPEGLHTIPFTHGIHRFPGKFIPNIPRYLIREYIPNDQKRIIVDPFCGSGTTLIESALEGRNFIGTDIDPLAVMISKAKTFPLTVDELEFLEIYWKEHDYNEIAISLIPEVPNFQHWFTDTAIRELSSIKKRCLELPEKLRLFSLVVFSSIIRRVSNADDQTQKTYVSHTLPKNPPAPSRLFSIFLERAISGMRDYSLRLKDTPSGIIIRGDVRRDIDKIEFTDVITSPPYIDSLDYVYNQMLEYFWLLPELGLENYEGYRSFRKKPMGFNEQPVFSQEHLIKIHMPRIGNKIQEIISNIEEKSPKEARRIWSFFNDYVIHLSAIRSKQKTQDTYISIVGNSFIRGETVPTAEVLVDIHESLGYKLKDKMTYEIKRHYMKFRRRDNSRTIKQDHILVFGVE